MRKILILTLLMLSVSLFSQENRTAYAVSSGTEYLETFFFNFGVSVIQPLDNTKELDIKCAINMKTEEKDGKIDPLINLPFKLNINFLFPLSEKVTFIAGPGVSPTIRLAGDDKGFLLGPNIKAGIRYRIHPTMSLYLESSYSLLIGPPKWMYSSTEIVGGINFFL